MRRFNESAAINTSSSSTDSYREFLASTPDDLHVEWVDGRLDEKPTVTFDHQQILIFLSTLLMAFTQHNVSGVVIAGRFQMHLANIARGREPDILFVDKSNLDRIKDNYLDGPADLAVEIVSPGGAIRDRGEKYGEYEASGVREYWIIDPGTRRADFFVLDVDGRYNRGGIDEDGIYRSTVIDGFWVEVNWLWRRPLPSIFEVSRQLGLI